MLSSASASSSWIISSLNDNDESSNKTNNNKKTIRPKHHTDVIKTRLILHLDINETILLGDDAGGDTRHDSIQKMVAKSAFVQTTDVVGVDKDGGEDGDDNQNNNNNNDNHNNQKSKWELTQLMEPTHWWDGQKIGEEKSMPPLYTGWDWPPNCCPYYRTSFKKYSKQFVDHPQYGHTIYKPVLEKCESELSKSHSNHVLPAFYETIYYLLSPYTDATTTTTSGSSTSTSSLLPFTIVFRTFGSDVDEMAQLISDFALGQHPDYPDVYCPQLCLSQHKLYQGRWKKITGGDDVVYQLWNVEETELVASGDAEILELLETTSICGIRDDYPYWKQHNYEPTAGKPIWVPYYDVKKQLPSKIIYDHHLIFDDNIHNLEHDGIVCVRQQLSDGKSFVTVDGSTMHSAKYQGINMIRVPTIEPVLNQHWFIEQIQNSQTKLQQRLLLQLQEEEEETQQQQQDE